MPHAPPISTSSRPCDGEGPPARRTSDTSTSCRRRTSTGPGRACGLAPFFAVPFAVICLCERPARQRGQGERRDRGQMHQSAVAGKYRACCPHQMGPLRRRKHRQTSGRPLGAAPCSTALPSRIRGRGARRGSPVWSRYLQRRGFERSESLRPALQKSPCPRCAACKARLHAQLIPAKPSMPKQQTNLNVLTLLPQRVADDCTHSRSPTQLLRCSAARACALSRTPPAGHAAQHVWHSTAPLVGVMKSRQTWQPFEPDYPAQQQ